MGLCRIGPPYGLWALGRLSLYPLLEIPDHFSFLQRSDPDPGVIHAFNEDITGNPGEIDITRSQDSIDSVSGLGNPDGAAKAGNFFAFPAGFNRK